MTPLSRLSQYVACLLTLAVLLSVSTDSVLGAPIRKAKGVWETKIIKEGVVYTVQIQVGNPRSQKETDPKVIAHGEVNRKTRLGDCVVSISPPLPEIWGIPATFKGAGKFTDENHKLGEDGGFYGDIDITEGGRPKNWIRPDAPTRCTFEVRCDDELTGSGWFKVMGYVAEGNKVGYEPVLESEVNWKR